MPLFVDNLELQRAPGAYGVELAPPVVIQGQVLGYIGFVFQGEWGPVGVVTEPSGSAEFNAKYFPPGSPHNSSGYYALMRRKRMPLRPVRIAPGAVAAVTTAAAGTGTYTATARYPGTLGNSITITWRAATDGDAAHRDLEVTLTHAITGTTTERVRNIVLNTDLDLTVTSANLPGGSNLLASLTFSTGSALPAAGTTATLGATTAGTAGTFAASDYETALNLLRLRNDIFVVCTDDPGDSIRDAVNDALVAHVNSTRNRLTAFQSSNQNRAWADVKTDLSGSSPTYRSDRSLPQGAWVYTLDDAGVARVTPFATYVACALVNSEPQQSHAWRDERMTQFYSSIAGIYAPFNTSDADLQGDATDLGIGLPVRLDTGDYASLHDRTSSLTAGKRFTVTRRLKDFFARSILASVQSFVNGSNWRGKHLEIKALVDRFLKDQSPKVRKDDPRVVAYSTNIDGVNTSSSIAAGSFALGVDAQTPSVMEKIGFLFNVGETVTVREVE